MTKQLLRVYDKNDSNSNIGKCYYIVLPNGCDVNDDFDYCTIVLPIITSICNMAWQNYTSYLIGTADVQESEMFWSEITNYTLYECKIDAERVNVTSRYKLHESMTGIK